MNKILEGKVVSVKMNNTAIVEITRRSPHPLYKKILKRTKKYKADMGKATISIGDSVQIIETRPIARDKHFKIMEGQK